VRSGFIGKVGDDPLGRLLKGLADNQVDLSCFQLRRQSLTRVAMMPTIQTAAVLFCSNADVRWNLVTFVKATFVARVLSLRVIRVSRTFEVGNSCRASVLSVA
jgi:hypothetical protein